MTAQLIKRNNIQSFCRTCLAEITKHSIAKGQKYNIHQIENLDKWIIVCTSLKVNKNDVYPKFICKECFEMLQSFVEFRSQCIKSMHLLSSVLSENVSMPLKVPLLQAKTEILEHQEDTLAAVPMTCEESRDEVEKRRRADDSEVPSLSVIKRNLYIGTNIVEEDIEHSEKSRVTDVLISEVFANYEENEIKLEAAGRNSIENKTFEYKNCDDEMTVEVTEEVNTEACEANETIEYHLQLSECESTDEALTENANSNNQGARNEEEEEVEPVEQLKPIPNKFQCEFCSRRCVGEDSLAAHMRIHQGLRPYQCNQCERSFNKASRLKMHIRENHQDNVEQFVCTFEGCDKQFRRVDTLRSHYRLKHTETQVQKPKTYMCEDCGRVFKNGTTLKEHRLRHRPSDEYPYQCDQCDKRYTSHRTFKEHQQRHAGIKNFVCPYCGMRKTTRNELRTHINYHTKEKQWPCPLCPSVFNSSANLGIHDRVVHKGIRRYSCRYCDQSFGKADTLKHHEMRHTGEKPHECEQCGKRFIQIVALRAHLKTHNKQGGNAGKKNGKKQACAQNLQSTVSCSEDEVNKACLSLLNEGNVDE